MNKKIIKTIASITCGLGIVSSIPFWSSNCGCSKNNKNSLYDFNSLDELLNFNPENYANFSLNPDTDYTDGNRNITPSNAKYKDYINKITHDMFSTKKTSKTKDLLAFLLVLYNLFCIKVFFGDTKNLSVEEFNSLIKECIKSFSLHITPVSDFKYIEKDEYDMFSFSCSSKMELFIEKDGKKGKITENYTINNSPCYLNKFSFNPDKYFKEDHYETSGTFSMGLKSEFDDFFTGTISVDDGDPQSLSQKEVSCWGVLPSISWLDIASHLQLSKSFTNNVREG